MDMVAQAEVEFKKVKNIDVWLLSIYVLRLFLCL